MIIDWPRESEVHHQRSAPDEIPAPPEIPVGDVPVRPLIDVPPIAAGGSLDPRPWLRTMHPVSAASPGVVHPESVWNWGLVEDQPALLSAPPPRYPEPLRQAGVAGRVVVQAVVDTLGRAEPGSLAVVASSDTGFDAAAREYVLHALFRPARVHGRAVRVLVRVPIEFMLRTGH